MAGNVPKPCMVTELAFAVVQLRAVEAPLEMVEGCAASVIVGALFCAGTPVVGDAELLAM